MVGFTGWLSAPVLGVLLVKAVGSPVVKAQLFVTAPLA